MILGSVCGHHVHAQTPEVQLNLVVPTADQHQKASQLADNQVSGQVLLDYPVAQAVVQIKCKHADIKSTTADADGHFVLAIKQEDLPCLLQASGGLVDGADNQVNLYAWVNALGLNHLNLVSSAYVAALFKQSPVKVFDTYAQANVTRAQEQAEVQLAKQYVNQQLDGALNQLAPSWHVDDFMRSEQVQNAQGQLVYLGDALTTAHEPISALLRASEKRAEWAGILRPAQSDWRWNIKNLPVPLEPAHNPMSKAKVELGRYLFYDVRLSGNQTFSCASCHQQDKAFTDGKPLGVGSTKEVHPRGPMSLANVAYNPILTWANPNALSLEEQADAPFFGDHPVEMGVNAGNKNEILHRLQNDKRYQRQFKEAFPNQDNLITWKHIKQAISSFERALISSNSRYDTAHGKGINASWSASEERGRQIFFSSANCFQCHGNFNFTDVVMYQGMSNPELRFHNTGLFNIGNTGAFPERNRGIFEFTKQSEDMGKFKAPTLRNIALTAPYMHDGSLKTLEEVLDFYGNHGRDIPSGTNAGDGRKNPYKSDHVNNIHLTEQDKADIIAFLKTLTDQDFVTNPNFSNPFK